MNLENINSFDNDNNSEKARRRTVLSLLANMERSYNKINLYLDKYLNGTNQEDIDAYADSITVAFNIYVQVFIDIISLMKITSWKSIDIAESLVSCVNYYKKSFVSLDFDEEVMIEFLVTRNRLIHDYDDYKELSETAVYKLISHSKGLLSVYSRLYRELEQLNKLDEEV